MTAAAVGRQGHDFPQRRFRLALARVAFHQAVFTAPVGNATNAVENRILRFGKSKNSPAFEARPGSRTDQIPSLVEFALDLAADDLYLLVIGLTELRIET